ncbi:hypothetical protein Pla175_07150 [Pirellulimonas nuda]|uniref:Transposase IS30-like HTH domain-containing protein n=1 Tax=Pirellulimonas nuda TaxID=2528009 RepID=A0A518D7D4_9BACT|nr:helix-turn-helix domain-containing protein [Pirellulimonas nuda]QDU87356.1 hypothetical protein Pla175_07150 [Pirellulimonas nuda]
MKNPTGEPPGRPRALTPQQHAELARCVALGMTLAEAAAQVGCSERTVQRARRRDAWLERLLLAARHVRRERRTRLTRRDG